MEQKPTILIADDSPLQAIMLRRVLSTAGYQVITAKHGKEALEFLAKQKVGLVISDINMPIMNGFELCKIIKNDPNFWRIPVILCTVLSNPTDLVKGIEVGADNYITRPWNESNLLTLIDDLLKSEPHSLASGDEEIVKFESQTYHIHTSRQYILNFLLTTYQNIRLQNLELTQLREELQKTLADLKATQKDQENILHNIFPEKVAQELIAYGSVNPVRYENVSVMFIDIVGFTKSSMHLLPQTLVAALSYYFEAFDSITEQLEIERIKTIGDGYMCACGFETTPTSHIVIAALQVQEFVIQSIEKMKSEFGVYWPVRIGIHTGPVVAGVIGKTRLAYDIWGETVNIASRMESHSEPNKINISAATYDQVKEYFSFFPRGEISVKNRLGFEQKIIMYFVEKAI